MVRLTSSRTSLNGEMAETITPTPLRLSKSATKPILRMFVSLSSRLKPKPLLRLVRTMSPSRTSTLPNLSLSSLSTISLMVVLPAPERPVNHSVKPRPYLLPFSISILPVSCGLLSNELLLIRAGLLDDPLLVAQAVDEDLDDLGATKLRRRVLALAEHLPHLRAREEDVRVLAVRARLRGRHPLAVETEEGVLEEERRYPELLFLELLEDMLGVVGAVVAPDPRVVPAHDEVRAAVVLAAHRVEDRLPRTRVPHRRREDRQDGAVPRVITLQDDLVALHPYRSRDVVGLRLADQRVEEEPVHGLQSALLDVLVGAVDGVPGLEADHPSPALLGEELPELVRLVVVAGERPVVRLLLQERHLPAQEHLSLAVEGTYAGVLQVGRTVDLPRLALLLVGVAVLEEHRGDHAPVAVLKGYLLALAYGVRLVLADGERDGHAPHQAAGEMHGLDDALVVLADHKARKRGEDAGGDHLQVGERSRADCYLLQLLCLMLALLALLLGCPPVD